MLNYTYTLNFMPPDASPIFVYHNYVTLCHNRNCAEGKAWECSKHINDSLCLLDNKDFWKCNYSFSYFQNYKRHVTDFHQELPTSRKDYTISNSPLLLTRKVTLLLEGYSPLTSTNQNRKKRDKEEELDRDIKRKYRTYSRYQSQKLIS